MKVFFSFTLKGEDFNISMLRAIKENFSLIEAQGIQIYIDLFDNPIKDSSSLSLSKISLNKTENIYQKKLIDSLSSSNILCVLNSEKIYDSEWVQEEIAFAKKNKIPIIHIDASTLKDFLLCSTASKILKSKFLHLLLNVNNQQTLDD